VRYQDAITALFGLEARGIRLGVERMAAALEARGHPERGLRFIHVAGTNGKGSVSAMLESCLRAAGYRTGLFTSPHLHRWVERIRIAGRPLGEGEATRRIGEVLEYFGRAGAPEATFFELTNLIAVEAFRDHRCDIVVLEVGLGGRLDSTNAFPSELACITRIAFDHMAVLGNDLASIAREKAGILKPGAPLVCGVREPEALAVIRERARELGVPALCIDRDFEATSRTRAGRFVVRVGSRRVTGLGLALRGEYQLDNAAVAVAALARLSEAGLPVPVAAIRRGLLRTRWPGRLERIAGRPAVLLDAAHNPDGCRALAAHLAALGRPRGAGRRVLLFAAMRDKHHAEMLALLAPHFDRLIYAPLGMERAAAPDQLAAAQPGTLARSPADGLARARRAAGAGGLVVVAGSIFLVAAARARLLGVRSDPPIRM